MANVGNCAAASSSTKDVPCPFRACALYDHVGARCGVSGLLNLGAAGELMAFDEGLWMTLCRDAIFGVFSGLMSEHEFHALRELIDSQACELERHHAARDCVRPILCAQQSESCREFDADEFELRRKRDVRQLRREHESAALSLDGTWRKLFLQARHLEPRWSCDGSSRTAVWGASGPSTPPSSLRLGGRDLLFVELYFSCYHVNHRSVMPSACRRILPLDLAQWSTDGVTIPLDLQFGSRYMEFADRYCASLELRICYQAHGCLALLCDTAFGCVERDDDVDRDGCGTYVRTFESPHHPSRRFRMQFQVRQLAPARVAMVGGTPKRCRASYELDAISIDDECEQACGEGPGIGALFAPPRPPCGGDAKQ